MCGFFRPCVSSCHACETPGRADQVKYEILTRTCAYGTRCQNSPPHCAHPDLRKHILRQHLFWNFRHLFHPMDGSMRSSCLGQVLFPGMKSAILETGPSERPVRSDQGLP
jgi:hypothetical protein